MAKNSIKIPKNARGVIALIAGILILVDTDLLAITVALFLIIWGILSILGNDF